MWKLVLVRLEIVLISTHHRCTVRAEHTIGLESFWAQDRCTACTECNTGVEIALGTPGWYSKVMYVKLKLVFVRLGIVLVSARDRCIVCAERTIGSEIFGCTRWYS